MGLARRNHGGELRRAPFRCRRPTDPLLPAGRVHLSLACAQPSRERPTAHPRRKRPLPCAGSKPTAVTAPVWLVTQPLPSPRRPPAHPGHSRSALLARGGSGLPALPSARSRPEAWPRRRQPSLSQCPTASHSSRCSCGDPLAYPLVLSAVYAGVCVVSEPTLRAQLAFAVISTLGVFGAHPVRDRAAGSRCSGSRRRPLPPRAGRASALALVLLIVPPVLLLATLGSERVFGV